MYVVQAAFMVFKALMTYITLPVPFEKTMNKGRVKASVVVAGFRARVQYRKCVLEKNRCWSLHPPAVK